MEISSVSTSASYAPVQASDFRAIGQASRDANNSASQQRAALAAEARNNANNVQDQADATKKAEAERAAQEARSAPRVESAPVGGSFKFEIDDGNRVMKLYDSRDVLIYQMPPKGQLTLIKSQEARAATQVEATA